MATKGKNTTAADQGNQHVSVLSLIISKMTFLPKRKH